MISKRRIGVFVVLLMAISTNFVCRAQSRPNTYRIKSTDTRETVIEKAAQIVPTKNQYDYKKLEYTCFVHFGVNTFTRKEWGDGFEDPKIFNLQNLDTDQWCRTAKEAGMKLVMFTAKHHDGFVLWQSRYTKHGVMSSPFKEGKGDVLMELSKSCKKYGLKLGVYLSPADLYQIENKEGLYGNLSRYSDRVVPRPVEGRPFKDKRTFTYYVDDYNEYFLNQLFELLTEYGPIHEVWFDGAHPKRKGGQKYTKDQWMQLITTLAPGAVVFGMGDVRWCGNESGATRASEWDVRPVYETRSGYNEHSNEYAASRDKFTNAVSVRFVPGEVDTSIREGWFYRDEETQRVRSADDVFDIYERCIGGNINLLLNVPPNREGRFSDEDVSVLKEVGKRIRETYGTNLLDGATGEKALLDGNEDTYVLVDNARGNYPITLSGVKKINRFALQEAIHKEGQRIEKHALDAWVDGTWKQVAEATTVGYKRILRFPEVTTEKLRLRILEGRTNPSLSGISAYYYAPRPPQLTIQRDLDGQVSIGAKKSNFSWKEANLDFEEALLDKATIRYTLDGSEPDENATLYKAPFFFRSGEVKARAFNKKQAGSVAEAEYGLVKKDWEAKGDSDKAMFTSEKAIDANPTTFWNSGKGKPVLTIDLKAPKTITGFIYTPPVNFKEGLMEKGVISVSQNGKFWKEVMTFDQGNLINDPTPRTTRFGKAVKARYVKIELVNGAGGSTSATVAEIDLLIE